MYDDITPYINLIKEIKKGTWYDELTLFSTIFFTVHKYLPSDDIGLGRYMTYAFHKDKKLSIKTVAENDVAFCSEKSGMAHNMFKFLGIDSDVVCGARGTKMHAYNFIYPNGYRNEPMVLYDPSHFLNFGFYKAFKKGDYESLISGNPTQIDLTKTEETYRKLYGYNDNLDDFVLENETLTYIFGLENAKNYKSSTPRK